MVWFRTRFEGGGVCSCFDLCSSVFVSIQVSVQSFLCLLCRFWTRFGIWGAVRFEVVWGSVRFWIIFVFGLVQFSAGLGSGSILFSAGFVSVVFAVLLEGIRLSL